MQRLDMTQMGSRQGRSRCNVTASWLGQNPEVTTWPASDAGRAEICPVWLKPVCFAGFLYTPFAREGSGSTRMAPQAAATAIMGASRLPT